MIPFTQTLLFELRVDARKVSTISYVVGLLTHFSLPHALYLRMIGVGIIDFYSKDESRRNTSRVGTSFISHIKTKEKR